MVQNAENIFRESNDVQVFGKNAPIKEKNLYIFLCRHFPHESINSKAHTQWLGNQHLDIYFPKYNFAIEFQGRQHYEAIDFFGGEEALIKNQERDKRKKKLCEENDCPLLYVDETTDRKSILEWVRKMMKDRA